MAGDLHPSSTHPPLPPTTEDVRLSHLRLLRSRRVGPATYHRLLTEYGTAQNALAALPDVARTAGVKHYEPCPEEQAVAELQAGARLGAVLLIHGHDGYPSSLMEMPDAPPLLWAIGQTSLLQRPAISLVGARNASALGLRMARSLSAGLGAQGYVVVSGLARGIDAAAHTAALDTGTIAVQAGGVDVIYPAENTDLAHKIAQTGLRLSEQPIGLQPIARHFPARNRIIAGLGRACVVIEAAAKSGSLITARDAADIGRDVMAVPGHPFDARAAGCNMLIRDGATLVRRAEDVTEALGPIAKAPARPDSGAHLQKLAEPTPPLTMLSQQKSARPVAPPARASKHADLHREILSRLGPNPVAEDALIRDLKTRPSDIASLLTDLEMDGHITRHSGGLISRREDA